MGNGENYPFPDSLLLGSQFPLVYAVAGKWEVFLWRGRGLAEINLEQYVQSTLRESQGNRWQHLSMAVRLPRWMKLASHRKSILKGIQHLKDRLE